MTNGWPAGWVVTDRTKKEIVTFRSVLYWTVVYWCCAHNLCEYVLGLGLCVYISRVSGRLATGGCGICLRRRQQRASVTQCRACVHYACPCGADSRELFIVLFQFRPQGTFVSSWKYSSVLIKNSARRTKILSDFPVFVRIGH